MWKSAIVLTRSSKSVGAFQAVVLAGLGVDANGGVEGGVATAEVSLLDPADDRPSEVF